MTEYCETCGRAFKDREDAIQRTLLDGQIVSKGKRRRAEDSILDDCGHIMKEHANPDYDEPIED